MLNDLDWLRLRSEFMSTDEHVQVRYIITEIKESLKRLNWNEYPNGSRLG